MNENYPGESPFKAKFMVMVGALAVAGLATASMGLSGDAPQTTEHRHETIANISTSGSEEQYRTLSGDGEPILRPLPTPDHTNSK